MSTMVRFDYARKGNVFLGCATIPTSRGDVVLKTMIPVVEIRDEVRKFLAASPIGDDPVVIAKLPRVEEHVANARMKRRLTVAIRVRYGGKVDPADIAGPHDYAQGIANNAAIKAATRHGPGDGAVSGYGGADVGKIAFKKLGKAFKSLGKGIGKAGLSLVKNPITAALLSVVPGVGPAAAVVRAVDAGHPGARAAIVQIAAAAKGGNSTAQQSLNALRLQASLAPPPPPPPPPGKKSALEKSGPPVALIVGGLAAAGAVAMLAMKK